MATIKITLTVDEILALYQQGRNTRFLCHLVTQSIGSIAILDPGFICAEMKFGAEQVQQVLGHKCSLNDRTIFHAELDALQNILFEQVAKVVLWQSAKNECTIEDKFSMLIQSDTEYPYLEIRRIVSSRDSSKSFEFVTNTTGGREMREWLLELMRAELGGDHLVIDHTFTVTRDDGRYCLCDVQ